MNKKLFISFITSISIIVNNIQGTDIKDTIINNWKLIKEGEKKTRSVTVTIETWSSQKKDKEKSQLKFKVKNGKFLKFNDDKIILFNNDYSAILKKNRDEWCIEKFIESNAGNLIKTNNLMNDDFRLCIFPLSDMTIEWSMLDKLENGDLVLSDLIRDNFENTLRANFRLKVLHPSSDAAEIDMEKLKNSLSAKDQKKLLENSRSHLSFTGSILLNEKDNFHIMNYELNTTGIKNIKQKYTFQNTKIKEDIFCDKITIETIVQGNSYFKEISFNNDFNQKIQDNEFYLSGYNIPEFNNVKINNKPFYTNYKIIIIFVFLILIILRLTRLFSRENLQIA